MNSIFTPAYRILISLLIINLAIIPCFSQQVPGDNGELTFSVTATGAVSGAVAVVEIENNTSEPQAYNVDKGYMSSQDGFQGFIIMQAMNGIVDPNSVNIDTAWGFCSLMHQATSPQDLPLPNVDQWYSFSQSLSVPVPGQRMDLITGFKTISSFQEGEIVFTYIDTDIPFPYTIDFNSYPQQAARILVTIVESIIHSVQRLKAQGQLQSDLFQNDKMSELIYTQYTTWIATSELMGIPVTKEEYQEKLLKDFVFTTGVPVEEYSKTTTTEIKTQVEIEFGNFIFIGTDAKVIAYYDGKSKDAVKYRDWALTEVSNIDVRDEEAIVIWFNVKDTIQYALSRLDPDSRLEINTSLKEKYNEIVSFYLVELEKESTLDDWLNFVKLTESEDYDTYADEKTKILVTRVVTDSFNRVIIEKSALLNPVDTSTFLPDWSKLRAISLSDFFEKYATDETKEKIRTILISSFSSFVRTLADSIDTEDPASISDWHKLLKITLSDWFDEYTDQKTKDYVNQKVKDTFTTYLKTQTEALDPTSDGFLKNWRETQILTLTDWFEKFVDKKSKDEITQGLKDKFSAWIKHSTSSLDPKSDGFLKKWNEDRVITLSDWFEDYTDNKTKSEVTKTMKDKFSTWIRHTTNSLDPKSDDFLREWNKTRYITLSDWFDDYTDNRTKSEVTKTMKDKFTTWIKHSTSSLDPKSDGFLKKWNEDRVITLSDWFEDYTDSKTKSEVTRTMKEKFSEWILNEIDKLDPKSDDFLKDWKKIETLIYSDWFDEYAFPKVKTEVIRTLKEKFSRWILNESDKLDPTDDEFLEKWRKIQTIIHSDFYEKFATKATKKTVEDTVKDKYKTWSKSHPTSETINGDGSVNYELLRRDAFLQKDIFLIPKTKDFPWWTLGIPPTVITIIAVTGGGDDEPPTPPGPCATDTSPPTISCPGSTEVSCGTSSDPSVTGQATASDNCSGVTVIYDDDIGSGGMIIRTWRATDESGNTSECTQTISVVDNQPPVLVCDGTKTADCATGTDPTVIGQPTATDNCGAATLTFEDVQSGTNEITRTWAATDEAGNTVTCVEVITIEDNEAPQISCDNLDPVECGQTVIFPERPTTMSDNCTDETQLVVTYSDDYSGLTGCSGTGIAKRIFTVTDATGNQSTCAAEVRVVDQTPPVISCPADISLDCGQSTDPANTGSATATDECDNNPVVVFTDEAAGPGIQRTWTASDACGNTIVCTQVITLPDNEPPVITCPDGVTVGCDESTDPSNTGSASATDNSDPNPDVTWTDDIDVNLITRTWTATDLCGNKSTCTQTLTIEDSMSPSVTCPDDISIQCDDSTNTSETGTASATDNCDGNPTIAFTDEIVTGSCEGNFSINRTWTATDVSGNVMTCTQVIFVEDSGLPDLTCPGDVTINCGGSTDPADTGVPTATDNCSDPVISYSDETEPGDCSTGVIITRTWNVMDDCQNSIVCTQQIIVIDIVAPVIICPDDTNADCGETDPTITGVPLVNDECDAQPELTHSDSGIGIIERTWTATDSCGNANSCIQIIILNDTIPPDLSCPADTLVECGGSTDPNELGEASSSDTSAIIIFEDHLVNSTIERIWTATDTCENSFSCTQIIGLEPDSTPPVIDCPDDISISCDESPDPVLTGTATASDNCGSITIDYTDDLDSGSCPAESTVQRTWIAIDENGNSASCVQLILLRDVVAPLFVCPDDVSITCQQSTDPAFTGFPSNLVDNCDQNPFFYLGNDAIVNMDCQYTFTIQRFWIVQDNCGNSSNCTQIINVFDIVPPDLVCPVDVTIQCNDPQDPSFTGTALVLGDNCDPNPSPPIFTDAVIPGGCEDSYTIQRIWSSEDACGNLAFCVQNIFVEDNTPPEVISVPPDITVVCILPPVEEPILEDNCDPEVELSLSVIEVVLSPNETLFIHEWTGTDNCGNETVAVQNITVFCITSSVMQKKGVQIYTTFASIKPNIPVLTRNRFIDELLDHPIENQSSQSTLLIQMDPGIGFSWTGRNHVIFTEFDRYRYHTFNDEKGWEQGDAGIITFGARRLFGSGKIRHYLEAGIQIDYFPTNNQKHINPNFKQRHYLYGSTGFEIDLGRNFSLRSNTTITQTSSIKTSLQQSLRVMFSM